MADNFLNYLRNYGTNIGETWSQDNANFEKGNPSIGDRVIRTVNPMSGFGSALGAMHDAASAGSSSDMAIAAAQAWPAFAAMRAVPVWGIKPTIQNLPSLMATLKSYGIGVAGSVGVDEAQARGKQ